MPYAIDDILRVLDLVPFSPLGASLIGIYSFWKARSIYGPRLLVKDFLRANGVLSIFLLFVALKTVNRALVRLVRNHGWRADKPKWSMIKGEGDVILITGGSTGIGKEIIEILAKKTDKIANLDLAEPTYSDRNVKFYKCDVTDPKAIAEVAHQVRKDIGQPTVLINNAGIARGKTILETTPEEFLLTYKVNVLGCHNILREFLPYIISINHGHIMTTASSASYMSIPQLSEYTCSKSAVLALHEVLNAELVHRYNAPRVRTSIICPTKVATQMGNAMKEQENQFAFPTLQPDWLAKRMVQIIESGLSDHLIAPTLAAAFLPNIRSYPEWFRWAINRAGKTHETITNEGNEVQRKIYTVVEQLDSKYGISSS